MSKTNEELASMTGWAIAEALGCHYSGDSSVIRHGGFFYNTSDWAENGYSEVVEFWEDPEDQDVVHVNTGTINKLDDDDMDSAFQCIGLDDEKERANVHAQIEACRSYAGIEPDDGESKTFRLPKWKERRIWGYVRPWIERLGD